MSFKCFVSPYIFEIRPYSVALSFLRLLLFVCVIKAGKIHFPNILVFVVTVLNQLYDSSFKILH